MNDEDAFAAHIVENPDDDTPRLVFADWLDEQGDQERAEFIRVQVELANTPEGDPRKGLLEGRERALLQHHAEEWTAPILPILHKEETLRPWDRGRPLWRFRRGFIEEVALDADVLPAHAPVLFSRWPIRDVWLPYTNDANHAMLADSPYLARLRTLDLTPGFFGEYLALLLGSPRLTGLATLRMRPSEDNSHVGHDALAALAGNPAPGRLRELDLGHNIELPDEDVVSALAGAWWLAGLERLCLRGIDLLDGGLAMLADLPALGGLRELDLSGNYFGDEGGLRLAGSPHLSGLRVLDLRNHHGDMGEETWAALREWFGDRMLR